MKKKSKKVKLQSIPRINRRLFSKWSLIVRERAKNCCEYCGKKVGENLDGNKLIKVDAHHLQSRKIKDNPLKFDINNSVCVCPFHHRFSCNESFHKAPVITINWLIKNHPERYNYVLEHFNDRVDLQNREVLKEIERCLDAKESLDINKLKDIAKQFPREVKERKNKEDLLDAILDDDDEADDEADDDLEGEEDEEDIDSSSSECS